jgi:hypothetical protein
LPHDRQTKCHGGVRFLAGFQQAAMQLLVLHELAGGTLFANQGIVQS